MKRISKFCFSVKSLPNKKVISVFGVKLTFKHGVPTSQNALREIQNIQFQIFGMKNRDVHFDEERKKLNNFLLFKYYYLGIYPNISVNLGDYVQTFCTQQAIHRLYDDACFSYYDRDSLADYSGDQVLCVMQGWFSHQALFLPNNNILPVFVGTHITPSVKLNLIDFMVHNPNYFNNKEIGCRDKRSQKLLADLGVKSYFSRCLTLTLPKREENSSQNKVFIVNIKQTYFRYIPQELLENAIFVNQRSVKIEGSFENYMEHTQDYLECTAELLGHYKNEARLIITSAIHCAMPCLAMGIPVILLDFEKNNSRFDVLDGILHIYNKKDLINRKVDFNPHAVDIEVLKKDILQNLYLSTEKARGRFVNENELAQIRQRIADFNIL